MRIKGDYGPPTRKEMVRPVLVWQPLPGFFRKRKIKKEMSLSSQLVVVVKSFLICFFENEGTEEPCLLKEEKGGDTRGTWEADWDAVWGKAEGGGRS